MHVFGRLRLLSTKAQLSRAASQAAPITLSKRAHNSTVPSESNSTVTSEGSINNGKEYPKFPNVGIGVVVLRRVKQGAEVLLVRRGREPNKGLLSFPGGSQELGESMVECAVREVWEETGLRLKNLQTGPRPASPRSLDCPRPFDAVDSIHRDSDGRIKFQFSIIEMAAVPAEPHARPLAGDDADEVLWAAMSDLPAMQDLASSCARIALEVAERFEI